LPRFERPIPEHQNHSKSKDDSPNTTTGSPTLRSVTLNDRFGAAWSSLASVQLQLRRPADAVDAARKAAELQPDVPARHLTLAQALWQTQAREEAMAEAHRAAALARTDQERRAAEAQVAAFERMR
jgi:hypothetical protein